MIVCVCNNVSDRKIRQAVHEGMTSMADLRDNLDVGTCCGKCHACAKHVLRECLSGEAQAHRAQAAFFQPGILGGLSQIMSAVLISAARGRPSVTRLQLRKFAPLGAILLLAVAIPATFGYNALVRGNKSTIAKLNKFGFDLHALFVTGARSGSTDDGSESGAKLTAVRSA